jgi:hypothetical protein
MRLVQGCKTYCPMPKTLAPHTLPAPIAKHTP